MEKKTKEHFFAKKERLGSGKSLLLSDNEQELHHYCYLAAVTPSQDGCPAAKANRLDLSEMYKLVAF